MNSEIGGRNFDIYQHSERRYNFPANLISVDAADGSGKNTFSEELKEFIKTRFHINKVLIVDPTKFGQSRGSARFEHLFKLQTDNIGLDLVKRNSYFMAALESNYKEIVKPAVIAGNVIILNSSEIRPIAYMLDKGNDLAVGNTLRWITSGKATANIFPSIRIILDTVPEECISNMENRNQGGEGDPTNIKQANRRYECYQAAVVCMKRVLDASKVTWIEIKNPRYEEDDLSRHLSTIVKNNLERVFLRRFSDTSIIKNRE